MKYRKEFEKWFMQNPRVVACSVRPECEKTWDACVKFMESRKCKNCKYYLEDEGLCPPLADYCGIRYCNCPASELSFEPSPDFYCKKWEAK